MRKTACRAGHQSGELCAVGPDWQEPEAPLGHAGADHARVQPLDAGRGPAAAETGAKERADTLGSEGRKIWRGSDCIVTCKAMEAAAESRSAQAEADGREAQGVFAL